MGEKQQTIPMWPQWKRIGDWPRGTRGPGLLAVINTETGKTYIIGTRDPAFRVWTHKYWLNRGLHPCPALQTDWTANPARFEFRLIVWVPWARKLPTVK